MQSTLLNDALEKVEGLPKAQREPLIDIVRRRLVEERRAEIAQNAIETRKAYLSGKAKRGSLAKLKKELGK